MVIILALLVAGVAIGLVARRYNVPYPVALVVGGFLIGFVPGLPSLDSHTDLLLGAMLPPILYQAALLTSWRDFRANLPPIILLALGLTLFTVLAVRAVAHRA